MASPPVLLTNLALVDVTNCSHNGCHFSRHANWQLGDDSHNPAKPCQTVFAKAVADKEWWNENLHRCAVSPPYSHQVGCHCRGRWHCAASSGAQRSNCSEDRYPGSLTRLTQASTEVPGVLWISSFPQRKKILRVQRHVRFRAKYIRSALTPMFASCARHWFLTFQHCQLHLLQLERSSGTLRREKEQDRWQ